MIYSAGVTDSGEKYKHIALPYDKITNLNNSEKDRLKKHIMLFNKLRKIIVKYSKKWLFYIRIFMARILQVNPQDIHELDVEKFMEYITSGKIPNPRLNLCQIILWVLQDDERVELESFVPENSIGRNSKLFKSKLNYIKYIISGFSKQILWAFCFNGSIDQPESKVNHSNWYCLVSTIRERNQYRSMERETWKI